MAVHTTREDRERTFLLKARDKHGNNYDYSRVLYVASHKPVAIICRTHGPFRQQANNHVLGKGCPQCAIERNARRKRLSKEEIMRRAAKAHFKNRYTYDLSNYENQYSKIKIDCPIHGEFRQTAMSHLKGSGCPRCATAHSSERQRLSTAQFVQRARAVHGYIYDYHRVSYKRSHSKVTILCVDHGPFVQTPNSHLNGSGCPKCASGHLTKEEFVANGNTIHKGRYAYDKLRYHNMSTKVSIVCALHGSFLQTPSNHLAGRGCPDCAQEARKDKKKETIGSFIEKANAVHGMRYDYSEVLCKNHHTKVRINCPEHGIFEQTPTSHLSGSGCPVCGLRLIGQKLRLSRRDFIEKAKELHGNTYDYSRVEYIDCKTDVVIKCPKHDPFEQTPDSHLNGKCGCPECSESIGVLRIRQFLKIRGIPFKTEVRFPECRNKLPLPFDFYLPVHRVFIEYHGQQHYHDIAHWHHQYSLGERRRIDKKKERFARRRGKYICIPYWECNRVEEILRDEIPARCHCRTQ